jgi:hypothetical protein
MLHSFVVVSPLSITQHSLCKLLPQRQLPFLHLFCALLYAIFYALIYEVNGAKLSIKLGDFPASLADCFNSHAWLPTTY